LIHLIFIFPNLYWLIGCAHLELMLTKRIVVLTYFLATFNELIYGNDTIFIFVHLLLRKKRIKHCIESPFDSLPIPSRFKEIRMKLIILCYMGQFHSRRNY
ncbi:mCG146328, partial [Mus musculus]